MHFLRLSSCSHLARLWLTRELTMDIIPATQGTHCNSSLTPHIKVHLWLWYLHSELCIRVTIHGICIFNWLGCTHWTELCQAIHQHKARWNVRSPTLWLLVTEVLFMVLIIVIKQSKDDGIPCVCLCLSSLFLFERNIKLVLYWMCVKGTSVRACMWVWASVHAIVSVCCFVCFWSWGEICWQVVCQERDRAAFETDTGDESQREGKRKRASFMWLCIPPRHSQREAQDETCVPSRHSLCLSPTAHPVSCSSFPIQLRPHLYASDLNIYQRAPCWNSSSASASWWDSQTHTHMHDTRTPCRGPICLEYCGAVEGLVLVVPWS